MCISTFLGCVQNKTEEKQTASSSSTENGGSHYEQLASLPFESGYPTEENSSKILADELYFQRATQVYLWALPAVNMYAMKEGLGKTFGEGYNVISVFEKRLKPNTVITTPNSDVIYALGFADLSKTGPLVLDVPPMLQGLLDDYWHRPLQGPKRPDVTHFLGDIGFPGPDKGKGGKYIVVPEGYKGKVPDGYFVYTSKTNGVFIFQRGFFKSVDNLEPGVKGVEGIKVYPLEGEAKPMDFQHASDIDSYALFSHDASYFEMLDRFIQSDKVDDVDPYMHGMLAAIGIKKGKKFSPSPHEKELLDKAAETAWRMAKNISANFDEEKDGIWWKDRKWVAHAHTKLDDFMHTLLDEEFRDRETGHVDVNAKVHMYVNHYSISTGMMSSIVGLGAKYGNAYKDSDGNYLMGENTYKITFLLPTRTNESLGSNRVSIGPSALVYYAGDKFSGGAVVQNYWSLGGTGINKVNLFSCQYIAYYNLPEGWFLESNTTAQANWLADQGQEWFIPIGGGGGKTFKIGDGKLFYCATAQLFYNAVKPDIVGDWEAVLQFQIIF
ncbi:DUF1254 domain-containing protein [Galbibacter sp. PAP.153]|uniref:DUF1254 domain-containing protein n=1 Tax=Galbibacter sp. PAP.153 TaxID=3104623 RepID=UPI003008B400